MKSKPFPRLSPHLSAIALARSAFLRLFFSSISRCSCWRISHRDFSCLLIDKNIKINRKFISLPAPHIVTQIFTVTYSGANS